MVQDPLEESDYVIPVAFFDFLSFQSVLVRFWYNNLIFVLRTL